MLDNDYTPPMTFCSLNLQSEIYNLKSLDLTHEGLVVNLIIITV